MTLAPLLCPLSRVFQSPASGQGDSPDLRTRNNKSEHSGRTLKLESSPQCLAWVPCLQRQGGARREEGPCLICCESLKTRDLLKLSHSDPQLVTGTVMCPHRILVTPYPKKVTSESLTNKDPG